MLPYENRTRLRLCLRLMAVAGQGRCVDFGAHCALHRHRWPRWRGLCVGAGAGAGVWRGAARVNDRDLREIGPQHAVHRPAFFIFFGFPAAGCQAHARDRQRDGDGYELGCFRDRNRSLDSTLPLVGKRTQRTRSAWSVCKCSALSCCHQPSDSWCK